jgi:outer membrane murein-binding lipoprotein Lpp
MRAGYRLVGAVVLAGLALSGCAQAPAEEEEAATHEVKVERYDATNVVHVRLTAAAAKRLGIRTQPVQELVVGGTGSPRSTIPSVAVIYDPEGKTWAYTNPQPLLFVRVPVVVVLVQGDRAILTQGPAVGTPVVTVGAALLLGAETGVGEE